MSRLPWFFVLCLFFCSSSPAGNPEIHTLGQENAVWSRSLFFRGSDPSSGKKLKEKDLSDFASVLKTNHIRYAYIFSGPYQNDGHLPAYAFSDTARKSILYLKKRVPGLKILPWIGGVEGKTVHLDNENWVKNSIEDTVKLLQTVPLDGVHIDLESLIQDEPIQNRKTYGLHWV